MTIREDFQRPRSERENAARRAEILEVAEALLLEGPNQRFSINNVARRVGISQSTVFLHFRNREELLTSLHTRIGRRFFSIFLERIHDGMSDEEFCEAFADTVLEFPGLRLMRAMIVPVVEQCLNQDFILEAVKEIILYRAAAAVRVEEVLRLEPGDGDRLMKVFLNLMCGAIQVDVSKYIETEGADETVAAAIRSWNFRTSFLDCATLALRGVRSK